jgi:hypothetical protein
VYDDYNNVPVSELERYYGVCGDVTLFPDQTGAGRLTDEEMDKETHIDNNNDWVDVDETEEAVAEANHNMYAEPVSTPKHDNPFGSDDSSGMRAFVLTLAQYEISDYIPPGFGMLPAEWENGSYPAIQMLPSGRRGSKQLEIGLPNIVWHPRSTMWVRALDIMTKVKNLQE